MMTMGSPLHSPPVASISVYNAKMVMASVMVETLWKIIHRPTPCNPLVCSAFPFGLSSQAYKLFRNYKPRCSCFLLSAFSYLVHFLLLAYFMRQFLVMSLLD